MTTIRSTVLDSTAELYAVRSAVSSVQMAAMAAAQFTGLARRYKNDKAAVTRVKELIDEVATMHLEQTLLATSPLNIHVAAGEGEADNAPGLRDGQDLLVGAPADSPRIFIATDPVEGTTLAAFGQENAVSVLAGAIEGRGKLMQIPDGYVDKWVWSRRIAEARRRLLEEGKTYKGYDPSLSPFEQDLSVVLEFMSFASGKPISSLKFEVLDRPRHREMTDALFRNEVHVDLLDHGDFTASLNVASTVHSTDASLGIGGSAEGLTSAVYSRLVRADYWQRVWIDPEENPEGMRQKWLTKGVDIHRIYWDHEIAAGDVYIAVCGITPSIIDGVRFGDGGVAYTHSVYGRTSTRTIRHEPGEHPLPPLINKRELYEKYDLR